MNSSSSMRRPTVYSATLRGPGGSAGVTFHDSPWLPVRIERPEPFFRNLEQTWNKGGLRLKDPHSALVGLVDVECELSRAERAEFLRQFLMAAATATRLLSHGRESACCSLEHHAHAAGRS